MSLSVFPLLLLLFLFVCLFLFSFIRAPPQLHNLEKNEVGHSAEEDEEEEDEEEDEEGHPQPPPLRRAIASQTAPVIVRPTKCRSFLNVHSLGGGGGGWGHHDRKHSYNDRVQTTNYLVTGLEVQRFCAESHTD